MVVCLPGGCSDRRLGTSGCRPRYSDYLRWVEGRGEEDGRVG